MIAGEGWGEGVTAAIPVPALSFRLLPVHPGHCGKIPHMTFLGDCGHTEPAARLTQVPHSRHVAAAAGDAAATQKAVAQGEEAMVTQRGAKGGPSRGEGGGGA